jgi:hypothetical protein
MRFYLGSPGSAIRCCPQALIFCSDPSSYHLSSLLEPRLQMCCSSWALYLWNLTWEPLGALILFLQFIYQPGPWAVQRQNLNPC